jgi:hypothetical protein
MKTAKTELRFNEGDEVTWSSQAGGRTKVKEGVVAEVVPATCMSTRERFIALYKGNGVGMHRYHESYVVLVGKKAYWPRVGALKPVDGSKGP